MTRRRKELPAQGGAGELRYRGFRGRVDYEVLGEPGSLRLGPARLRGSISATPEIAEQVFRECEGELTLESGTTYRITVLGHSTGSGVAYFEMRV
jgi:hypothetical protein